LILLILLTLIAALLRTGILAHAAIHTMTHVLSAPGSLGATALLASLGSGVSEEILFRVGLMAVIVKAAQLLFREPHRPSPGTILWRATILQAYLFGLSARISRRKPEHHLLDLGESVHSRPGGAANLGGYRA
jgi:hypothetical protein